MPPERFGALPLGELHAEGVCCRCGARFEFGAQLKRTVKRDTLAIAHICIDTIACERRRHMRKV